MCQKWRGEKSTNVTQTGIVFAAGTHSPPRVASVFGVVYTASNNCERMTSSVCVLCVWSWILSALGLKVESGWVTQQGARDRKTQGM